MIGQSVALSENRTFIGLFLPYLGNTTNHDIAPWQQLISRECDPSDGAIRWLSIAGFASQLSPHTPHLADRLHSSPLPVLIYIAGILWSARLLYVVLEPSESQRLLLLLLCVGRCRREIYK